MGGVMLEVGSSFILGALFVLWLEYLRRPRLRLTIEAQPADMPYPEQFPARHMRTVQVTT
jgi:hypothetical protein